jgi:hypothetical protein
LIAARAAVDARRVDCEGLEKRLDLPDPSIADAPEPEATPQTRSQATNSSIWV